MQSHCDPSYTNKWMKKKLLQRFEDQILICSKHGRDDVVVFYEDLGKLLLDFRSKVSTDAEEEKARMIKLVAKFIVNDMVTANHDKTIYLKLYDITAEEQLQVLPESLLTLLQKLVPRRSKKDRSAAISCILYMTIYYAPHL